jgi:hypothetical protein
MKIETDEREAWTVDAQAPGSRISLAVRTGGSTDNQFDLEGLRDPRIVPFLLRVLAGRLEFTKVRIHVLKRLRNGRLRPECRPLVADVILEVVSDRSNPDLRLQASLALGSDEPIDLRHSAFTSLQRAGSTPECVTLLRLLSRDATLGRSARSLQSLWRLE